MDVIAKSYFVNSSINEEVFQGIDLIYNWEFDLATETVTWSEELFRIFGVEPPEAPNSEELMELTHPSDREILQGAVDRAIAEGPSARIASTVGEHFAMAGSSLGSDANLVTG